MGEVRKFAPDRAEIVPVKLNDGRAMWAVIYQYAGASDYGELHPTIEDAQAEAADFGLPLFYPEGQTHWAA